MKKTYQLKTNAIKGEPQVIDIAPATGKAPVTVPAAAGARYELIDAQTRSGPDNVRVQRKGKNLQVFFDGDTEAGVVIEDFYQVHTDSTPTLVGRTDQGTFYEYIPEIAAPSAIVTNLNDTGVAYGVALGGQELAATSGAAIGALVPLAGAFSPLLVGGAALGAAALAGGGGGGGGDSPAASPVFPDPNVMPNTGQKTAISLNAVTGDNIITTGENAGNIALTGKVTGYFAADDIVTVYVNGKSYTGKALADGSFSINVPASELAADKDTKIEAKVIGTGGDTANGAQDYVLETAANAGKQTALSIDTVTDDNLINASEKNSTVNITGKVTGSFTTSDTITLTINGKQFTGTPAADGSYSIPVPGADLFSDSDTTVEASINSSASAIQNYGAYDVVPTNAGMGLVIKISSDADDSGVINISELNGANQLTSHITVNNSAKAGDKVVINATNDSTALAAITHVLTAADITNGFNVSFAKPADGQAQKVYATYLDAAGNVATDTTATDNATLDITAPSNTSVGLSIQINTDADDSGAINIFELNGANQLTSHITVNNSAKVGDKVVINATNGSTALTAITHILTATDITNGFDVAFAKPADGQTQSVTANYVDAAGNAASDSAPTDSAKLDITATSNASVGLGIAIKNDADNNALVGISELNDANDFTSHITVNNSAKVGDKVVINATNGSTALTAITHILTTADITNGFDVGFAKPADGQTQSVTANYVDAAGNAATDTVPTDNATLDITPASIGVVPDSTNNVLASLTFSPKEAGTYQLHINGTTYNGLPKNGKLFENNNADVSVEAKNIYIDFWDIADNHSIAYLVDSQSTAKYTIKPGTAFFVV